MNNSNKKNNSYTDDILNENNDWYTEDDFNHLVDKIYSDNGIVIDYDDSLLCFNTVAKYITKKLSNNFEIIIKENALNYKNQIEDINKKIEEDFKTYIDNYMKRTKERNTANIENNKLYFDDFNDKIMKELDKKINKFSKMINDSDKKMIVLINEYEKKYVKLQNSIIVLIIITIMMFSLKIFW